MAAHRSPPHLATLIALTATAVATLNMFLPSLANIARDLGADYGTVSLAISGYLAMTAMVALVIGPLSDRVGRRPVMLGALSIFLCASVGCALAEDVTTFLTFRMIQSAMAAGNALSVAIVRDTRKADEAASLIGYISMAMAVAPMLGPMLGGFLDATFGWRAAFWVYAGAGGVLLLVCWRDLGETRGAPRGGARPSPFALLGEPLYWAYALCTMFSLGAFFIFLTGAPLVALSTFGVEAAELGVYIGSITGGFMAGSFLTGRLARRVPAHTLILSGRLVAFLALSVGLIVLLSGIVSPMAFFGATIFVGFGNGLTIPNSNTRAVSIRPDLAGTAAGWGAALSWSGGAVLTGITGQVLPEEGGAALLLALMLGAVGMGLVMILWAIRLERRAGAAPSPSV